MKRSNDESSEFFETAAPPSLLGNASVRRWRPWNNETNN